MIFFCCAVSSCVNDPNHPYLVSERLFLAENKAFPYPRREGAHPRRAGAMDPFQVCCLGEKWRLSVGRSRGRARQNHREAMEEGEQRLLSAKTCSEEEAKELRALLRTYLVTNLKV